MKSRHSLLVALGLVILAVIAATSAHAQAPDPTGGHTLDGILHLYRDGAASWSATLQAYALKLFWMLALIEFAWAALMLALRGADFGEWAASVVNQILFIGFFLTLLKNSATWSGAIVNSFRQAANAASTSTGGGANISPSNIFDVGLSLANKVVQQSSFFAPADSLGLVIAALIILICFALISAFLILALVESYVVVNAGILLMGFGGSRWTKDYAVRVIQYAVSVGAKLFVLQLLIGLGEAMIQGWVVNFQSNSTQIFVMVGSAIVMLALTKSVPDIVQALINGQHLSSGSALLGAAAAAGGAAAGFAGGMVGASAAVHGAGKLASEQLAGAVASGTAPASRIGRFASLTGGTAKNLGSAAISDIGARLGGRAHHGMMPGRMSDTLHAQAREAAADRNKPAPPQPPGGTSPSTPDTTA